MGLVLQHLEWISQFQGDGRKVKYRFQNGSNQTYLEQASQRVSVLSMNNTADE